MYLARLEIQGFKTFAKKTVIQFPKQSGLDHHALTVIVGPNGSGKSNLTDAIRWCLGEQSMKQLRGKKSEDIIFSGSAGKSRSGFADVSMTFDNHDKALDIDYKEVTITRRLYRDGDGEYLLNGKQARLADIQLLLAEAGIGQRTYTVIGQGMIDHVLTASPEERKIFFDDATGVRGLQIKRKQSMNKLKRSTENLVEAEMLMAEIEPRLKLLRRQVQRLDQRADLETELHDLQTQYFGTLWHTLHKELEQNTQKRKNLEEKLAKHIAEIEHGDAELAKLEQNVKTEKSESEKTRDLLQKAYREAQKQVNDARKAQFEAERDVELAKVKAQSTWAPLPLHEIIQELDTIVQKSGELGIKELIAFVKRLRERLTKPNPTDFQPSPEMQKRIQDANDQYLQLKKAADEAEKALEQAQTASPAVDTRFFDLQRQLRIAQKSLHQLEQQENALRIEQARIETRIDAVKREMQEEIIHQIEDIIANAPAEPDKHPEQTRSAILRIKHKLELIGSIDEETIQEYEETKERFEFLEGQIEDLHNAIKHTEQVIDELDERIQKQSAKAFKQINTEFQKYFKVLFGGGSCSLVKLQADQLAGDDTKVALDRAMEELAENAEEEPSTIAEQALKRFKKRKETVAGIDIQATPPGKKLKALNLLSGGERALTSIALLSAIMATNPSPFVVLDEVDAALDEANTVRFANILNELRKLTQFIVVTHNRATMERGDLLYGVTMGNDGISNLLSVNITDIEAAGSARR